MRTGTAVISKKIRAIQKKLKTILSKSDAQKSCPETSWICLANRQ